MTRATSITVTITAPDMDGVREGLVEYGLSRPRNNEAALWLYVQCLLVDDAAALDGVFLSMEREEKP